MTVDGIDVRLSMKREDDKIYLLWNLIEVGYWTKEDFAQFKDFGEQFWAGDFEHLILPSLHKPEPSCTCCNKRESKEPSGKLCVSEGVGDMLNGIPLCADCFARFTEEARERETR